MNTHAPQPEPSSSVTVDMRDILKVQALYADVLQQLGSATASVDHTNEFIRCVHKLFIMT